MLKKLIVLLGSFFIMNVVHAIPLSSISQVYFFGDSLTDSGYNDLWSFPPLPAGKQPTWTNYGGYIWSQYLARDVIGYVLPVYPGPVPPDTITNNSEYPVPGYVSATLTGVDYAAGGSTTNSIGVIEPWAPSLHQQVAQLLSTNPVLDPNAVYFIWSGANDVLGLVFAAPPLPTQLQLLTAAYNATVNIGNEVRLLVQHGAKRIVVLSLPNIGYTPLISEIASANNLPELPGQMKTLTFTFNSMLNTQLGHVIAQYGVKILYVDVYDLLDDVISTTKAGQPYRIAGQEFLFVNYSEPACTAPTAILCESGAPTNYVFADSLHPSAMAHRVLSLAVEQLIQGWK